MKKIFSIILLSAMIGALSACKHNKQTNMDSSYSDGSGNAYFITENNTLKYDPVTPEMSSSGVYSGGDTAEVKLSMEDYDEIMELFNAAMTDTGNHVENRAMMTGAVEYNGKEIILAQNAASKENLEKKLRSLLPEGNEPSMGDPMDAEPITIEGELLNTKGGPSVDGVHLPENEYDEYIGKNVKVTGTVTTIEGGNLVNEKGEYSAGWEGSRKVMETVDSIEIIEQ